MKTQPNRHSLLSLIVRGFAVLSALALVQCNKPQTQSVYKSSPASADVADPTPTLTDDVTFDDDASPAPTAAPRKSGATGLKNQKKARKPANTEKLYIVQIGAFSEEGNARRMYEELKAKDYPVMMRTTDHASKGKLTLVRLTPTPNRAEAEEMITQLRSKENVQAVLLIPKQ